MILVFVAQANEIIKRHFGVKSTFDLIICKGEREMRTQIMSKIRGNGIVQRKRQAALSWRNKKISSSNRLSAKGDNN